MNIIFGENVDKIKEKYTVLELDTFRIGEDGPLKTAYCVVESIPITEMESTHDLINLHQTLLEHYKNGAWDDCKQTIEQLVGKWSGELDSFYLELSTRISELKTLPSNENWSHIINKV